MLRLTFVLLTLLLACCVHVVFSAPACSLPIAYRGIIDLSNIDIPGSGYKVAATDANFNFYLYVFCLLLSETN